jgi:type I restriction enzyme M protein
MPAASNRHSTISSQGSLLRGLQSPKDAFRKIRNYLAGQHIGATRDEALLDELLKCLFCKLYIEIGIFDPVASGSDDFEQSRYLRTVFARVKADFTDLYEQDAEIMLDPAATSMVLYECDFSLVDSTSDPIGDAFEVFVGSESRGRNGQFFTPRPVTDLLVRAVNPQPGELVIDPACGAGGFITSVAQHYKGLGVSLKDLGTIASKTLFGIDKDDYLTKLAKFHISLLTDGHPNVTCGDSLSQEDSRGTFKSTLPPGGFDVLLTNPPFGAHIVAARPEVLGTFELARKWKKDYSTGKWSPTSIVQSQVPPQVLFVERCIELLKPGGRMGIVLPESILSNKSYRYVMEYLQEKSDVRAVIGMPESLFKTSGKGGTHTKTCLVIAHKRRESVKVAKAIFMAEARWCGHDSRARSIPHNDLPTIANNLVLHNSRKRYEKSTLGFTVNKEDVRENVLCPRYYDPKISNELEGLAQTHDLYLFRELVDQGILSLSTGDELGKLAYGTGTIPFIRTSDISNWELKADPKHGVDKKIYDSLSRKQDVRAGDLLMVKDGTYLIGTCAIISEADVEILYQSHLYKIRVQENPLGIDPYLLLAVLSSPIVQRQVKSKQFTQDIIDSLGERIQELILPIPKESEFRANISGMVRTAVDLRIRARELAKSSRLGVHGSRPSDETELLVVGGDFSEELADVVET